jgi:hypothetical protein
METNKLDNLHRKIKDVNNGLCLCKEEIQTIKNKIKLLNIENIFFKTKYNEVLEEYKELQEEYISSQRVHYKQKYKNLLEDYMELEEEYLQSQRVKYKIKYMKHQINLKYECQLLQTLIEKIHEEGWNENFYLQLNNKLKKIYEL